jgi:hypothetical protein
MTFLELRTLNLMEKSFCLGGEGAVCQPDAADLAELYEAEIELALAA